MLALAEIFSEGMGAVERGFEVLALGEMCFEGMEGVEKGGLRYWHWVKCVLRAWGQLKKGAGGVGTG